VATKMGFHNLANGLHFDCCVPFLAYPVCPEEVLEPYQEEDVETYHGVVPCQEKCHGREKAPGAYLGAS